jgi:serine/threonine protein kinase
MMRSRYSRNKAERTAAAATRPQLQAGVITRQKEARKQGHAFDEQLAILARLCRDHFPELPIQCKEEGVELMPRLPYDGLERTCASDKVDDAYDTPLVQIYNGRILSDLSWDSVLACVTLYRADCTSGTGNHAVYRTQLDGREVCLKEYSIVNAKNKRAVTREVQILNRLSHPGIVDITGVISCTYSTTLCVYIEMEFYPNGTLEDYRIRTAGDEDQSPKVFVAHTLAAAIGYMHSCGVVHRDIKMENVFMTQSDCPILGDFDISTDETVDQTTMAGAGTLLYIAPEVTTKSTGSSDMFAYGCVLMFLFHAGMKVPMVNLMSEKNQAIKLLAEMSTASTKDAKQRWKRM